MTRRFVRNVVLKSIFLFVLANMIYALINPLPWLSQLTLYNVVFPGRTRFPYSDDPSQTYSVTLARIEAMFASHIINGQAKSDDEFRVLLVGDSSVWGWLLDDNEALGACLNAGDYRTVDGRRLVTYNLGYPVLSAVKDSVILQEGLQYQPDAAVWLITLQTLMDNEQLRHPILQTNRDITQRFIDENELALEFSSEAEAWLDRTIVGQRRDLADLLRYQIYGLAWWSTGLDHTHTDYIGAPMNNLPDSQGLLNRDDIEVGSLDRFVAWDVLHAGMNSGIPTLLVNQPIFISDGLNSDVRYNEYYPRWAYDLYREHLTERVAENQWTFVDMWDAVPINQFTDTPFHYNAEATCAVADLIAPYILELAN